MEYSSAPGRAARPRCCGPAAGPVGRRAGRSARSSAPGRRRPGRELPRRHRRPRRPAPARRRYRPAGRPGRRAARGRSTGRSVCLATTGLAALPAVHTISSASNSSPSESTTWPSSAESTEVFRCTWRAALLQRAHHPGTRPVGDLGQDPAAAPRPGGSADRRRSARGSEPSSAVASDNSSPNPSTPVKPPPTNITVSSRCARVPAAGRRPGRRPPGADRGWRPPPRRASDRCACSRCPGMGSLRVTAPAVTTTMS